jgi:hypothetical protein
LVIIMRQINKEKAKKDVVEVIEAVEAMLALGDDTAARNLEVIDTLEYTDTGRALVMMCWLVALGAHGYLTSEQEARMFEIIEAKECDAADFGAEVREMVWSALRRGAPLQ